MMGIMFNLASTLAVKQIKKEEERNPSPPPRDLVAERETKTKAFMAEFGERLEELFKPYPNVYYWTGISPDDVTINVRNPAPGQNPVMSGRLEFEDDGYTIKRWGAKCCWAVFSRKGKDSLIDSVKVGKIEAMLKDREKCRKYCDIIASLLLENDEQAFNVLEALGCDLDRFESEYYDESWIKAWEKALISEFSASRAEYTGKGIFMLTAI